MAMNRLQALAAVLVVLAASAMLQAQTKTPFQKLEERVAALEAENQKLRERLEKLEPAVEASKPAVAEAGEKPAARFAVGMSLAKVQALAEQDGTRFVKVATTEDTDGKRETWKQSRVISVPDLPPGGGAIEMRNTKGYRPPMKEQVIWSKLLYFDKGVLVRIEQQGSSD